MSEGQDVTISGEEAVDILWELECLLISLRNIGLHYYMREEVTAKDERDYRVETARFICDSQMISRLEKIKGKLSDRFEACCGREELDLLRKKLKRKRFWKAE
ncbi:hypothetical protein RTH46_16310 [Pseudomonas sp. zfem004]|uniref:hypothetical protein n=1 Tax=Pseudomonas sp. zfem004 TaxID=3078199 RepID=UPI002927CF12|nr:hypothetical protein [Pseudomonas sp. zfem004]MDU9404054.1 hypothetical protein [Pseudomonas sp. zfem004]